MKEQNIVRDIMKLTNTKQIDLQAKLGLSSQSSVSAYLKTDSMRVDKLCAILNVMGCELVVRGHGKEWVIGDDNKPVPDLDALLG